MCDKPPTPFPQSFEHEAGIGFLHRGQQIHEATELESGERVNLVAWFKSSEWRLNNWCPMCRQNDERRYDVMGPLYDVDKSDEFEFETESNPNPSH